MNTNSRLCPNCRSPLNSTSCRRCGFKQKTLKIVETQDYGKSMNYGSRIQHVRQVGTLPKRITERQKLLLYLKEYQQMMKKTAQRIVQREDNRELGRQFMDEVKFIWEGYLLKRKQKGLGFAGMFKKYINGASNHKQKYQKSDPIKIQNHEQNGIKMQGTQQQMIKEQQQLTRKRGRGRKAGVKSDQPLSIMTQFRCFFNKSVKPFIADSIEQRKINDSHCMTVCQKSFLAYLLAVRGVDTQFMQFVTSKYLKMVIGLRAQPVSNFIREKDVQQELNRRHCGLLKKKDQSSMLVLLIDLLICWNNQKIGLSNKVSVRQMLEWYADSSQGSEIIDRLKLQLDDEHQQEKDFNVPIINYQLVYSIMYLAACRVGLCLSVGEIVTVCSRLEIGRIAIQHEQNQFLAAIVNEESITVAKTRRTTHLLAYYLQVMPINYMAKWSEKWCIKFGLEKHLPKVFMLNSLLFGQVKELTRGKLSLHEEMLNNGKLIQYRRYQELQQDTASLAGIMLLLKLSNGLTDYPYLIHSTPDQLSRHYTIDQAEIKIIKDLITDRQITIQDISNKSIRTEQLPRVYEQPICVLDIAKKLSYMSQNDKQIGRNSIQRQIIRLRNLSHLNYIPIFQLIEHFRKAKENREQQQRYKKGIVVQLRFDEMTHKQRVRQHFDMAKTMRSKKCLNELLKPSATLNDNLIKQLQCIVGKDDKVVELNGQQPKKICLLDYPSSNYELMYDYGDNLMLTGRQRQMYFMQMLCLNLCTFGEMSGWINRYEAVLKQFERD